MILFSKPNKQHTALSKLLIVIKKFKNKQTYISCGRNVFIEKIECKLIFTEPAR